jgi:predicted DNA-binding ribbon-helix-helix protein
MAAHRATTIPTFLVFREGRLVGRMTSYRGEEFFLSVLREQAAHR